jgi:E3 ubiquitin-protein ligase HUWE1
MCLGVLDLTFVTEESEWGHAREVELVPGGRHVVVTEQNKADYVRRVTTHRLTNAIRAQLAACVRGFREVLPPALLSLFDEAELALLISGLPDIDPEDWRANSVYEGYSEASSQITWFWRAVRAFSREERAKLLQFVTGSAKVPMGGFARLEGSNGNARFIISRSFGGGVRLPTAHTWCVVGSTSKRRARKRWGRALTCWCMGGASYSFNKIDLPEYEDYEQLVTMLRLAINEGAGAFGFA